MKETILRSKKFPHLILQLFNDSEFGMLGENLSKNEEKEDDIFIDNVDYAYEMYKLLEEADRRKTFDGLKDSEEDEIDTEEVLI